MSVRSILLTGAWVLYLLAFLWSHIRVRLAGGGRRTEKRVRSAGVSGMGMALQFIAITASFVFSRPAPAVAWPWWCAGGVAAASIILTWAAVAHLGRQWRLQAVVTDDHELIRSGPYARVRHPVYTALLGMLVATALVYTVPVVSAGAGILFVAGTELRIRAEDRILSAHFDEEFRQYRDSTPAWLPPIR